MSLFYSPRGRGAGRLGGPFATGSGRRVVRVDACTYRRDGVVLLSRARGRGPHVVRVVDRVARATQEPAHASHTRADFTAGSGRPRVFPSTSEGVSGSLCARRVARCDAGDARGSERSRARHSRVPEGDAPSADSSMDTTSPKNFWRQINTSNLPRIMTVLHVQSVVHLAGSRVWSH